MADWQKGDLALRVGPTNTAPLFPPPPGHSLPVKGGIYVVEAVTRDFLGNLGLVLEGHHSSHPRGPAWMATSFRKIKPLTDAEREEALRDLKAPVREPAA